MPWLVARAGFWVSRVEKPDRYPTQELPNNGSDIM
jgi:hypothetical protein